MYFKYEVERFEINYLGDIYFVVFLIFMKIVENIEELICLFILKIVDNIILEELFEILIIKDDFKDYDFFVEFWVVDGNGEEEEIF